jgi:hypothetical protein
MPDVDGADARRGAQLFPVLFWGGVGLAPLAALLILLGSGGTPVRIGAVLGVLAPVLIGVSFALRPDPDSIRLQFEETLLEELDLIRAEVRGEIATSARASHQMVGERLGVLQQSVDTIRAAGRAGASAPVNPPPVAAPPPYQVAAAPAPPPPPVSSRASVPRSSVPRSAAPPSSVAPPGMAPRSTPPPLLPPQAPSVGRHSPPASVPGPAPSGNGRASVAPPGGGRRGGGRPSRQQADGYRPASGGRAAPPSGGAYRRAETGQFPRSGYPEETGYPQENGHNGDRGRGYNGNGSNGGGQEWSPPAPRGRPGEPYEESWTDQKLRERYGRRPRPYDRDDTNGGGEPWRQREDGHWVPVSAEPVTRGRRRRWEDESSADLLRGGEHAGRHSGDTGTQPRYEDRWAPTSGYGNGYSNGNGYGSARPDYTRRALPPAPSTEPSWNDSWDEPAREARSHRYRPDFELTDERWR